MEKKTDNPFTPDAGYLPEYVPHVRPEESPSLLETFGSAYEREFLPASTVAFFKNKPGIPTPEENENYLEGFFRYEDFIPEGFEEYEKMYARYALSERHADWLTGNIIRERENAEVLDASGSVGFMAQMIAAMTSPEQYPTYFIPGALLLKPGVLAGSRATGLMTREAAIAAGSSTISEMGLQTSQATRTAEESVYAIAGSTVFAGLLTGAIAKATSFDGTLLRQVDDDIRIMDEDYRIKEYEAEAIARGERSAGAMETPEDIVATHQRLIAEREEKMRLAEAEGRAVDSRMAKELEELKAMNPRSLSELKHPRLAKALGWASPAIRMARARMPAARELAAQIIDDPMLRNVHEYGGQLPQSIETAMVQFEQEMGFRLNNALDEMYSVYKKANNKAAKTMNHEEFSREVSKALRKKDTHADPVVTQAAQRIRREVMKPIEARLDAQDLLPREVTNWSDLKPDDLKGYIEPEDMRKYFTEGGVPKKAIQQIPEEVRISLMKEGKLQSKIKLPKGDESYLHRLWDFDAIDYDKQGFIDRISDYIEGEARRVYRENSIDSLMDDLTVVDAKIKKKEVSLAKAKTRAPQETPEEAVIRRERVAQERLDAEKAGDVYRAPKRNDAQILNDLRTQRADIEARVKQAEAELKVSTARTATQRMTKADEIKVWAQNTANDIADSITNSKYTPTLNVENKVYQVGPLKLRVLDIPSEIVEDYLENHVGDVMAHYVRTISPQLHMKEVFEPSPKTGPRTGTAAQQEGVRGYQQKMEEINAQYRAESRRLREAGDIKGAKSIDKEREAFERDIDAMVASIYNRYKIPDNPDGWFSHAARRLREFNTMTLLGMVTISSIPDIGQYIARRGLMTFARDMSRFATNFKAMRVSSQTMRKWGVSADLQNSARFDKLYMMDDDYRPIGHSVAARWWGNARTAFSKATLMPYWNNTLKSMAATSFYDDLITDAIKAKAGKLSRKKIQTYAKGGIDESSLVKIADNVKESDKIEGTWLPDLNQWADQEVASQIKRAIRKEVDTIVVTPGKGDLPLMSKSEVGKLVFQFKSFAFAANQRILMAGLDDMTASQIAGLMSSIMLGYLSYAAKETVKGNDFEVDYDTFVREGLDRSGRLAFWGDLNGMVSKATAGEGDAYRLLGTDKTVMSRYASRNIAGALAGVSAGRIQDVAQATGAIARGEISESDARAVRRLFIYNNLWMLHRGFTEMEKAIQ